MIAEMLEWCATPCPWFARRNGLLAAQIAIRHRARRCRTAWIAHLEACRKFVSDSMTPHRAGGHLVILGSGHLNDFDLPFLQSRFDKITLVDAVHPLEISIRSLFSKSRLKTLTADLSKPSGVIEALVAHSDWTVSSCLLSQLPLFSDLENSATLFDRHLELLRKAPRSILITDVARRAMGDSTWETLLDNHPLPRPDAEWIWQISPPGESGPVGEERRIQAFAR